MREMREINECSALGFSCGQDDKDPLKLKVLIFGDFGPKYENGMFTVTFIFPEDYPCAPPVVKFDSKIFHPNIDKEGNINLDILDRQNWLPSYSLASILACIKSLLAEPCPSWPHPANPEATDLFLENRAQYNRKVKAIVEQTFCEQAKEGTAEVEASRSETETKEGVYEVKQEVTTDEKAKGEVDRVKKEATEEKSAAEVDSKVEDKEGIEEQCPEGADGGLRTEESLEKKTKVLSKVTNLKKRLSFKW